MIDPVPTQCVVVDREFARRPLDRPTGGKKPLDPHAFDVIASLTAPRPRTFLPRHRLPRLMSFKKILWVTKIPFPRIPRSSSPHINRGGMARQGKSGVTLLSAAKNICVTRIFLLTFPTKTPRFSERNSLPQREQAMTDKFIVSRAEAVKRLWNRHSEECERCP